jgi:hypothetical protein
MGLNFTLTKCYYLPILCFLKQEKKCRIIIYQKTTTKTQPAEMDQIISLLKDIKCNTQTYSLDTESQTTFQ